MRAALGLVIALTTNASDADRTGARLLKYVSTRGEAPVLGFEDTMLAGLARDGGLYVPAVLPNLDVDAFDGLTYAQAAFEVMAPFVGGEIPDPDFRKVLADAYATFAHPAVCPLVQIGANDWVLELFHGPTLAFKDVAMQVLGRLMDRTLIKRGARATVIGATSGDTGSAAIEAFKGRDAIDIFILHPHGRTSDVQRKQMTTATEANVHNIAIEGTFDDCQALVKALFNDHAVRDRLQLAGVNSINWVRIMAQATYYLTAASSLGVADNRRVSFAVPTGNFGDVFAGNVAAMMGLPLAQLIVATNSNDILARAFNTGVYEPRQTMQTQSPSMDIQVSSNFERLLYYIVHCRPEKVRAAMDEFKSAGRFRFDPSVVTSHIENVRFEADAIDEATTTATIADLYKATGYLADPHTAVGIAAARRSAKRHPTQPMVCLATAHPAKFPDAVAHAIGRKPEVPERLARVLEAKERFAVLPNDYTALVGHIGGRARIAGAA